MREAHISLARLQGDVSLLAPLSSNDSDGPNSAELRAFAVLCNHFGIGANMSIIIEHEDRLNDATIELLLVRFGVGLETEEDECGISRTGAYHFGKAQDRPRRHSAVAH